MKPSHLLPLALLLVYYGCYRSPCPELPARAQDISINFKLLKPDSSHVIAGNYMADRFKVTTADDFELPSYASEYGSASFSPFADLSLYDSNDVLFHRDVYMHLREWGAAIADLDTFRIVTELQRNDGCRSHWPRWLDLYFNGDLVWEYGSQGYYREIEIIKN